MGTYYYYYCIMRVMACAGVWFLSGKTLMVWIGRDRKDVREIFEPVVSQVLELISKQVIEVLKSGKGPVAVNPPSNASTRLQINSHNLQAILLVGGLGSSEYLYQRINKWGSGKIAVMQPRNAWT